MPIETLKSSKNTTLEDMSDLLVIETYLMISSTISWIIDSGSNVHLCTSILDLKNCRRLRLGGITLRVDNEIRVAAATIGTYPLRLPSDFCLELKDCYCVPNANKNLIYVSCLTHDDYEISFNKDHCTIYFENKMVACGQLINSFYHLHADADESINLSKQTVSAI